MRSAIILAAVLVSGCTMTPTQQKWAAVGVSLAATGLLIAHEQDSGKPVTEERKRSCYPGNPCLGGK